MPPGAQAVQACHAAFAFAAAHGELTRDWLQSSSNLVLAAVEDEPALAALAEKAGGAGLRAVAFREPDLDNAMTALAIEPAGRRLCGALPLALRPRT